MAAHAHTGQCRFVMAQVEPFLAITVSDLAAAYFVPVGNDVDGVDDGGDADWAYIMVDVQF